MELKIFNKELNLIGIIDSFSSLIWNRKYNLLGDFQMNILFSSEVNEILNIDNIIYKDNGECAYITSKEINVEDDGSESIEVKGKFVLGYLERRIILKTETLDSNVVDGSYKLIDENCINSSEERKIPNLILDEKPSIDIPLVKQVSNKNLLDTLMEVVQANDLGIKVDFDMKLRKLIFKLYKGINRGINQNIVAPVIFSRSFENVLNQNYLESNSNFKNVVLVAGAGEGTERKTTTVGDATGLERHEIYVDARDLSNTKTVQKNGESVDEQIPDSEYIPLLETRGREKLAEHYKSTVFDSTINPNSNYVYKQDYDLGDIVTFFDNRWNITMDARITEVSEVYSSDGLTINITFGNDVPTLLDIIKRNR